MATVGGHEPRDGCRYVTHDLNAPGRVDQLHELRRRQTCSLSDALRRPFDDALDYATFSVNVPPRQVAQALRPTLEAIAHNRTRLRAMQRALWEARPAFDWTDTSERGALFRTLQDVLARLGMATTGV